MENFISKIRTWFYDNPKRGVYVIVGVSFLFFSINMIRIFRDFNHSKEVQRGYFKEAINRTAEDISGTYNQLDYDFMEGFDYRLTDREYELIEILEQLEEKGEGNLTSKDSLLLEELHPELERLFDKLKL